MDVHIEGATINNYTSDTSGGRRFECKQRCATPPTVFINKHPDGTRASCREEAGGARSYRIFFLVGNNPGLDEIVCRKYSPR